MMSPSSSGRSSASGSTSSSEADQSGRQRLLSESSSSKGPVSKVIDLFRHRSNSAVSSEEKRRSVSLFFIGLFRRIEFIAVDDIILSRYLECKMEIRFCH